MLILMYKNGLLWLTESGDPLMTEAGEDLLIG